MKIDLSINHNIENSMRTKFFTVFIVIIFISLSTFSTASLFRCKCIGIQNNNGCGNNGPGGAIGRVNCESMIEI